MSAAAAAPASVAPGRAHVFDLDRGPDERYVLYALRGGELHTLGTAATPADVGVAIVQLHEDQKSIGRRLADLGALGLRDAQEREWIVLPWGRGGGR